MRPQLHAYALLYNDKFQCLASGGVLLAAASIDEVKFVRTIEEGEAILEKFAPFTTRKDYQIVQVVLEEY